MAREYSKTKGPGTQAKPDQHQFFRRLAKLIKFTLGTIHILRKHF